MLNFFIKRKINSAFNKNDRKHVFRNIESMQKILILFSYQDWNQVTQIARDLENRGKQVILWTVHHGKQEKEITTQHPTHANLRVVGCKDLSCWRVISPAIVKEFKSLSYDTLIDLTTNSSNALLYLLANNSSEFCIGIKELDHKASDFIILKEEDKDLLETYGQIKFYLNNIH